ncbi:MAG: GerAB/ArcD/ProY family transporter [Clostridia bacterium]|nr:GerAB/ArcD/ProY family transporter [Clostridia bacterium]
MNEEKKISGIQFASLAFISRIACAFTGIPNLRTNLPTSDRISVFLIGLLLSLLLALPVLLFIEKENNRGLQNREKPCPSGIGRIILIFYAAFFVGAGILAVSRLGVFASGILLQKNNLHLFTAILIIAGAFCAERGLEPTARVSVLLSAAVLGGLLFTGLCDVGKMKLENLSQPFAGNIPIIVREAFFEACMNVELPVLMLLAPQIKIKKKTHLLLWLPLCFVCISAAFAVAAAVAGHYADLQVFPLHSLAVIAKTALFERIDDLLASLWVSCTVLKTGILLYTAYVAARTAVPACKKRCFFILTGALVFGGYLLLTANIQFFANVLQSAAVPVLFLFATVFIPLFTCLKNGRKEHKEVAKQ